MDSATAVFTAIAYVLKKYDRDFAKTFVAAFEKGLEIYVDNNHDALSPLQVQTLDLLLESLRQQLDQPN